MSELVKDLQSGLFQRITVFPDQKYFLCPLGRILSLNSGEPKLISGRKSLAGEVFVTLYTPSLKIYKVSKLMLLTFVGEPEKKNLVPGYKDGVVDNFALLNLHWIEPQEILENQTQKIIEQTKLTSQVQSKQGRYLLNDAIKYHLSMFNTNLARSAVSSNFGPVEQRKINKLIDEVSKVISMNVIDMEQFKKINELYIESAAINHLIKELIEHVEKVIEKF